MKSRNKVATNPLLKKGHAHKSVKDYDRKKSKKQIRDELNASLEKKPSTN